MARVTRAVPVAIALVAAAAATLVGLAIPSAEPEEEDVPEWMRSEPRDHPTLDVLRAAERPELEEMPHSELAAQLLAVQREAVVPGLTGPRGSTSGGSPNRITVTQAIATCVIRPPASQR